MTTWLLWLALVGCGGGDLSEGDALFAQGELDRAQEAYLAAGGGAPSAATMRRLGDVAYRQGDVARAIGWWRAAREIDPRDATLVHNLALARASVAGLPDPAPPLRGWTEVVTPTEATGVGVLWLALASGGGIWRRRALARGGDPSERPSLWASPWVVVWLLGAILFATGWSAAIEAARQPVAVVAVADAAVRAEPLAQANTTRALAAGQEVRVLATRRGFVRVAAADGASGWVVAEDLFQAR